MKALSVIWDAGHSGTINGVYKTPGKRSPKWSKGVLYEGVANRWIVNETIKMMDFEKLPYYHISPEYHNVPLRTREIRANNIYKKNRGVYGVSMHFNAAGGTGWEIFTSHGETLSDYIAHEFIEAYKDLIPLKARLGGNKFLSQDKEANYAILKNTDCPFILIEGGFMDNKKDYEKLWDPEFHTQLATANMIAIRNVNRKYGRIRN